MPVLQPQAKEKSLSALLSFMKCGDAQSIWDKVVQAGSKHKNWRVRESCLALFSLQFDNLDPDERAHGEDLVPQVASHLSDAQSGIRLAALEAYARMAFQVGLKTITNIATSKGARPNHVQSLIARAAELGSDQASSAPVRAKPAQQHVEPPKVPSRGGFVQGDHGIKEMQYEQRNTLASRTAEPRHHEEMDPAMEDHPMDMAMDDSSWRERHDEWTSHPLMKNLLHLHAGPWWRPGVFGDLQDTEPPTIVSAPKTQRETQKTLESIATTLSNISNPWKDRNDAIAKLRNLLHSGMPYSPGFAQVFQGLREPLAVQLTDMRSAIVRSVCILIAEASALLSNTNIMEYFADTWFPPLAKLTQVSIGVIAASAHAALVALLHNTRQGYPRVIPKILAGIASKSALIRARCAEFTLLVLRGWSVPVLERNVDDLAAILSKILVDADPTARAYARTAYWSFFSLHEQKAKEVLKHLDASATRLIQDCHEGAIEAAEAWLTIPMHEIEPLDATRIAVGDLDRGKATGAGLGGDASAVGRVRPWTLGRPGRSEADSPTAPPSMRTAAAVSTPLPQAEPTQQRRRSSVRNSVRFAEYNQLTEYSVDSEDQEEEEMDESMQPVGRHEPDTGRTGKHSMLGRANAGLGVTAHVPVPQQSAPPPLEPANRFGFRSHAIVRTVASTVDMDVDETAQYGSESRAVERTVEIPGQAFSQDSSAIINLAFNELFAVLSDPSGRFVHLRQKLGAFIASLLQVGAMDPRSLVRALGEAVLQLPVAGHQIPPNALHEGLAIIETTSHISYPPYAASLLNNGVQAFYSLLLHRSDDFFQVLTTCIESPHEHTVIDALGLLSALLDTHVLPTALLSMDATHAALGPTVTDMVFGPNGRQAILLEPSMDLPVVIGTLQKPGEGVLPLIPLYARFLCEGEISFFPAPRPLAFFHTLLIKVLTATCSNADAFRKCGRRTLAAVRRAYPAPLLLSSSVSVLCSQIPSRLSIMTLHLVRDILGDQFGPETFHAPNGIPILVRLLVRIAKLLADAAVAVASSALEKDAAQSQSSLARLRDASNGIVSTIASGKEGHRAISLALQRMEPDTARAIVRVADVVYGGNTIGLEAALLPSNEIATTSTSAAPSIPPKSLVTGAHPSQQLPGKPHSQTEAAQPHQLSPHSESPATTQYPASAYFKVPLTRSNLEVALDALRSSDSSKRLRALHYFGRAIDSIGSAKRVTTPTEVPPELKADPLWMALFISVVGATESCIALPDGMTPADAARAQMEARKKLGEANQNAKHLYADPLSLSQTALSVVRKLYRNCTGYILSHSGNSIAVIAAAQAKCLLPDLALVMGRTLEEVADQIPCEMAVSVSTRFAIRIRDSTAFLRHTQLLHIYL